MTTPRSDQPWVEPSLASSRGWVPPWYFVVVSTPKIEDYFIPPMELVGVTAHFRGAMEPDADYDVVIPALWQRLDGEVATRRILGDRRFGLITVTDVPGVMRYEACILATGGDTSTLSPISFPGGRYVCVEHEGTLEGLAHTVQWFYGCLLYTSDAADE